VPARKLTTNSGLSWSGIMNRFSISRPRYSNAFAALLAFSFNHE